VVRPRDPWSVVPPAAFRGRDPLALASDPNAPWADLVRAALVVPDLVACNPGFQAGWASNRHVLGEPLPDDVFALGLFRLAGCATAPPELIERTLRSDLPTACACAWSNPGLDDATVADAATWWLKRIHEGRDRRVDTALETGRVLVLSHPRTPTAIFATLADGASWSSLAAAGTVPRADETAAARVFTHLTQAGRPRPPAWVRAALARHGRWATADLRHAGRDRSPQVRTGLATRPELPDDLMASFLHDRSPAVRLALATRDDLPPLVAACLEVDPDPEVRRALRIATRRLEAGGSPTPHALPRTLPRRVATRRARDPDPDVRHALLADRRVALATLARWAWNLHEWRHGQRDPAAQRHPPTNGENRIAHELHERLLARAWGITRVVGRRDEDETRFVRTLDPSHVFGGWEGYVWVDLPAEGDAWDEDED